VLARIGSAKFSEGGISIGSSWQGSEPFTGKLAGGELPHFGLSSGLLAHARDYNTHLVNGLVDEITRERISPRPHSL
jgi:hypothetical protein